MKNCEGCHLDKDILEFSKNKRSDDSLQSRCKDCHKQYRELNKQKNKDKDFSNLTTLDCQKCGETKDISEFSPKQNSPRGLDYWCKVCRRKYARQYRVDNGEEIRQYERDCRAERIKWLQDFKSNTPCADCGQIYEPSYCMDYDHVPERGQKIANISRMVLNDMPMDAIMAEIAKCDLVCALCHNKRTYDRFNAKSNPDDQHAKSVQRNIDVINQFKSHPCVFCGQQYELYNMQIDHIDPSLKLYDVCSLKSCKLNFLLMELSKCQPVCALCHRRKSIEEQKQGKYKNIRVKIEKPKRVKLFNDLENKKKECFTCHEIKDYSGFRKLKRSKDGYASSCRDCLIIYKKKNKMANDAL